MDVEQVITDKLNEALHPVYLSVENESHMHNVAADAQSHFKVIVATSRFAGKSLVERHREINRLLSEELSGPIHALALHTLSEEEWQASPQVPDSPPCRGGSKLESD